MKPQSKISPKLESDQRNYKEIGWKNKRKHENGIAEEERRYLLKWKALNWKGKTIVLLSSSFSLLHRTSKILFYYKY